MGLNQDLSQSIFSCYNRTAVVFGGHNATYIQAWKSKHISQYLGTVEGRRADACNTVNPAKHTLIRPSPNPHGTNLFPYRDINPFSGSEHLSQASPLKDLLPSSAIIAIQFILFFFFRIYKVITVFPLSKCMFLVLPPCL